MQHIRFFEHRITDFHNLLFAINIELKFTFKDIGNLFIWMGMDFTHSTFFKVNLNHHQIFVIC